MKKLVANKIFLACLFYILLVVILFIPVLIDNKSIFFGDNYYLIIPQKLFFRNSVLEGIIPFWNPFLFSGIPFLADINHASFYPSSIFFVVINPIDALNLTVFIHLIISAIGAYLVSRKIKQSHLFSLIAGVVWAFSEFMLSAASSNLSILQSNSWLPWIVLTIIASINQSKFLYLLPLFITLSILGGHPQLLAFLLFFSGLYLVFKRKFKLLFGLMLTLVTTILINLWIVAPFVELSQYSTRATQLWSDKTKESIKPAQLIQWVIPNFFSNVRTGIFWGPEWDKSRTISGYSTILVLVGYLFLFRIKKNDEENYLYFIGWVSLIFSLGNNIPLVWDLISFIPGLNGFRNPSALVGLQILAVASLSGKSISTLQKTIIKNSRIYPMFIIILFCLVIIQLNFKLFFSINAWNYIDGLLKYKLSAGGFHTFERDWLIIDSILKSLTLSLVWLSISLLILLKRKGLVWLPIVIAADVLIANGWSFHLADRSVYELDNKKPEWIKNNLDGQFRLISGSSYFPYVGIQDFWNNYLFRPPFSPAKDDDPITRSLDSLKARAENLGADWNLPFSIPLVNGYGAFVLKNTADYWDTGRGYMPVNDVDKVSLNDPRISDQGVKYVSIDASLLNVDSIEFDRKQFSVVYQDEQSVILENLYALPIIRFLNNKDGKIRVDEGNVNQINFSISTTSNDFVLIKMANYPGWKCTIDSQPCSIIPDGFTMKVAVPEGDHQFELNFTPTGWPYLAYISGFGWSVYLILLLRLKSKNKKLEQINKNK